MRKIEVALLPEEAASTQTVRRHVARYLSVSDNNISGIIIRKRSVDARSRNVKIRLSLEVYINEEFSDSSIHERPFRDVSKAEPVYIAGCGPAGLFAAMQLIEYGIRPVIMERGKNVRDRRRDLAAINRKGIVNPDSNYCFGEGGAGTYSDGKLYTRSGKRGSIEKVLETFVQFGAERSILIDAHPHIGTNKLPRIIESMREMILQCGGEIHFETKLTGIEKDHSGIKSISITQLSGSKTEVKIKCNNLILATGHSARDIFQLLHDSGIYIEAKPFAIGVRIEHRQSLIDTIQYHCSDRGEFLPPASYSLVHQDGDRGVYSFCMCPGGIIAPAATSEGEIVVNGWSPSKRNNPFANSGIVVSVNEGDYAHLKQFGPLAAMHYQSSIEQTAFTKGGGKLVAPAQRMMDFLDKRESGSLPPCSYVPGIRSVLLDDVLGVQLSKSLRSGLSAFGRKMKGYLTNEAVLVGVESRTSSPVRIPRDKDSCMHINVKGLFPCAEGAGYAGGIVSAAMDGERCADAVVRQMGVYSQPAS